MLHEQKNICTVLSSKYIVFDKKSIPIVACTKTNNTMHNKYNISAVKMINFMYSN